MIFFMKVAKKKVVTWMALCLYTISFCLIVNIFFNFSKQSFHLLLQLE